jgi:hypothetical protein
MLSEIFKLNSLKLDFIKTNSKKVFIEVNKYKVEHNQLLLISIESWLQAHKFKTQHIFGKG